MAAGSSVKVVIGAIGANILIGISKFVVFGLSGSSAMLAEGIHSLVDSLNGVLLYFGIKKSKSKPTTQHPFGRGMEVYFWSFVVSMLVFLFGGVIAVYEGLHHLGPGEGGEKEYMWSYIVLISAFFIEGASLIYGLKKFNNDNKGIKFFKALRDSKDAPTIAIVLEELAAILGILLALTGTLLVQFTGIHMIDGITSIAIGVLLIVVAFILARETKALLIGEGVSIAMQKDIESIIFESDVVLSVLDFRTMYLSSQEVLIATHIDVKNSMSSGQWEIESKKIENNIVKKYPMVRYCYLSPINHNSSML